VWRCTSEIPAHGRLRQEDHGSKGSLTYIVKRIFSRKKIEIPFPARQESFRNQHGKWNGGSRSLDFDGGCIFICRIQAS
jgi:hypothetical protein